MKLIVGLGNPGAQYARHRHNIGFMAVDRIAESHGFGPWRSRFQGQTSEGHLGGEKVLLLKPQTYMNDSGRSVGEAMRFLKVPLADLIVLHDEIDLAPAKLKVKTGGGHAGHNGLRSLHAHVGDAYHRVRLGVGHPGHKDAVPGYVLHDFPKADREGWVEDLLRGLEDAAPALGTLDWTTFQNKVALRLNPPRAGKPAPEAAPKAKAPEPPPEDSRSPLQKLADRFR
ncbi:Peptidyl-tRNA hydrolase [Rubellimicrobium mesophilum DSM 19309]|uniref:Peptidyl-tRNA hydrolase n=1 Tax=Rubellimicrobium mesophilum DSM 19309 TaxID=442562 RepID=A0A017HB13_9RHOB|nr:aminoacyl-tRNA hydrolase [Rubellimicrobium mesophilum]EYD71531.1 Peptidyl-tRNA hydrolase [Rubellimicrobium mesophilum DSM 19309]